MLEPGELDPVPAGRQADLAGDAPRGEVLGPDQADHAGPAQDVEGVVAAGGGGLGGEPPAPERAVDQVADVRLVGPLDPPRREQADLPRGSPVARSSASQKPYPCDS